MTRSTVDLATHNRPTVVSRVTVRPWASSLGSALLVLTLAFSVPGARAEEPPELVTDRPDQTESATVVPQGTLQLEMGWLASRDTDRGRTTETRERPGTLLRFGLARRVELRVGWDGALDEEREVAARRVEEVSGVGDAEIGAKIHLMPERGARPEMALLAGTSVPIGDDELTSDRLDPSFRLSLAHTLSERIGLGYNLGMTWASELDGSGRRVTHSFFNYTAAVGFSLSPRWGTFVEVFGDLPVEAPGGAGHALDGGFTFLVRDNLQLDVFAGVGLSREAADELLGFGLSLRLPR